MWSKRDVRLADVQAVLKVSGKDLKLEDLERYTHGLSTGGHNDWRVPKKEEFDTIAYLKGKKGWSPLFEYSAGWYLSLSEKETIQWGYNIKTRDVCFRPVRKELKTKTIN